MLGTGAGGSVFTPACRIDTFMKEKVQGPGQGLVVVPEMTSEFMEMAGKGQRWSAQWEQRARGSRFSWKLTYSATTWQSWKQPSRRHPVA